MIFINELIATITATSRLFVESLRKDLTNKHVHPWFTTSIPNIIGHPIIFLFLALSIGITFPKNILFYLIFFMVGFLTLASFYFKLKGFTKSLFSSCIAIGATSPFFKALGGVIFLGEQLNSIKWSMLIFSFVGIMIIVAPKKQELSKFKFEKGFTFTILSVIIGAMGGLFYKYSANLVENYTTFLMGRLIADYVVYGLAILFAVPLFNGFNARNNWFHFFKKKNSNIFLALVILESLIGSYLIFVLPISILAVIGTITIPLSFMLGRIRYNEKQSNRTYIGSFIVFVSIIIFVLS